MLRGEQFGMQIMYGWCERLRYRRSARARWSCDKQKRKGVAASKGCKLDLFHKSKGCKPDLLAKSKGCKLDLFAINKS